MCAVLIEDPSPAAQDDKSCAQHDKPLRLSMTMILVLKKSRSSKCGCLRDFCVRGPLSSKKIPETSHKPVSGIFINY